MDCLGKRLNATLTEELDRPNKGQERGAGMSWEEDFRRKYPCPCGEGEYEEIHFSDDWGRSEEYVMLCPKCKEKYVYDHTIIHGHPGDFVERGWVLKEQDKSQKG